MLASGASFFSFAACSASTSSTHVGGSAGFAVFGVTFGVTLGVAFAISL
jgi:hypothetical protein